jgi:hypothetical protein
VSDKNEVERLLRLREQQLRARDPEQAARRRHMAASARPRAAFSLRKSLGQLPAKLTWALWGALVGLAMGMFFSFILTLVFQVGRGEIVIVATMVFGALLGRVFGGIKDSGRENWLR